MISDTLCEAIYEIRRYLDEPDSLYGEASRARIEPMLDEMAKVLTYLDTPPTAPTQEAHKALASSNPRMILEPS